MKEYTKKQLTYMSCCSPLILCSAIDLLCWSSLPILVTISVQNDKI